MAPLKIFAPCFTSFFSTTAVRSASTPGKSVGVVQEVEGTAGGSRLIVGGARGEVQIPLAMDICTTIDVAGRRIVIEPPEGLLELNDRT